MLPQLCHHQPGFSILPRLFALPCTQLHFLTVLTSFEFFKWRVWAGRPVTLTGIVCPPFIFLLLFQSSSLHCELSAKWRDGQGHGFSNHTARIQAVGLPLLNCITLSKETVVFIWTVR